MKVAAVLVLFAVFSVACAGLVDERKRELDDLSLKLEASTEKVLKLADEKRLPSSIPSPDDEKHATNENDDESTGVWGADGDIPVLYDVPIQLASIDNPRPETTENADDESAGVLWDPLQDLRRRLEDPANSEPDREMQLKRLDEYEPLIRKVQKLEDDTEKLKEEAKRAKEEAKLELKRYDGYWTELALQLANEAEVKAVNMSRAFDAFRIEYDAHERDSNVLMNCMTNELLERHSFRARLAQLRKTH